MVIGSFKQYRVKNELRIFMVTNNKLSNGDTYDEKKISYRI